jgi:NADH dehydrogenase
MRVFISGIRGFLGRHLARHLSECGYQVAGTTTRIEQVDAGERIFPWRFGSDVSQDWLRGTDIVIHCAHDFAGSLDSNLSGTRALVTAARAARVPRQIFISSLSARADAESQYGRTKFTIEQRLAGADLLIVRPGTIIGGGGLFGRMCDMLARFPVLPLVGAGQNSMYLIGVSDLSRAIERILRREPPATFNLYYAQTPSLKQVLQQVKRLTNRRTLLVPVPPPLIAAALTAADWLRIRLPMDRDNLRGFMKSQRQIYETHLPAILEQPQTVEQALTAVLPGAAGRATALKPSGPA